MAGRSIVAVVLVATLAGCGAMSESRLNPMNWFGRTTAVETDTTNVAEDPRPLVSQLTDLRLEKVPGGAIVRATGLPPRQGYFDAALVPMNGGVPVDGVLAFQFRVAPPLEPTAPGTPQSREVIVGLFVTDQTLAATRTVRVSAAGNALAVRR
jgi:hypothetical protein